jgi:endonuclease G
LIFIILLQFFTIGNCAQGVQLPICHNSASEIILQRCGYTVSYNQKLKLPNWVFWHLTKERADGDVKRPGNAWQEDMDVPEPRANSDDYRGSGWSRGHMCPAGDNKWDTEAMSESNLLSNMCPQHASLNSGLWNVIERDCRKWAVKYGEVYIVSGPVFMKKKHETIGSNKVVVPEAFFKVVLCLTGKPKALGVVVRNTEGTKKKDLYYNSIDEVERITGYDFFPALPDDIENKIEAKANIRDW